MTLIAGFVIYKIIRLLLRDPPPLWRKEYMENHGPGTRRLGYTEKIMYIEQKKGNLLLCNALILQSKKKISEDYIRMALTMLAERHPLLSKCVREDVCEGEYFFKDMEEFQADIRVDTSENWMNVMENELLKKFENTEKGPLWRVVLLPDACYKNCVKSDQSFQCVCLFIFHHSIVDGTSYARLFGEFLDRLDEAIKNQVTKVEKMDMLPPMDAYIEDMRTNSAKERIIRNMARMINNIPLLRRLFIRAIFKIPHYIKVHQVEEVKNIKVGRRTCIIPVELPVAESTQVLAACKRRKVKVHGALQTAAAIAYAKLVTGGEILEELKIGASPTVNLRPYLDSNVPSDYLGAYFTGCPYKNKVGPEFDFWELAATASTQIHSFLQAKKMMSFFHIFYDCGNLFQDLLKYTRTLPGRRWDDMVFTNLGNISFLNRDESSSVKIIARYGCSGEHNSGNVFANNIATFEGKVFWTFVYYSNITSEEVAKKFSDLTIDILVKAVQP